MIDKFVPDMFYQSIYRVDYEKLKNVGIKLIIFDLDNTIMIWKDDYINALRDTLLYFNVDIKYLGVIGSFVKSKNFIMGFETL